MGTYGKIKRGIYLAMQVKPLVDDGVGGGI
jgi:hypothetical protein